MFIVEAPFLFLHLRQTQHFNYTWMRTLRQQDLCVASSTAGSSSVALQPCDNSRAELRWYHKSSDSALVGFFHFVKSLDLKARVFLFISCFVSKAEHLIADFVSHHMCLEAEPRGDTLRLKPCNQSDSLQKWQFTHYHAQG